MLNTDVICVIVTRANVSCMTLFTLNSIAMFHTRANFFFFVITRCDDSVTS